MEYPKLRFIDAFPIEHEGASMFCLRDPQNTKGRMLLVSPEALYIISYFNGKNSILDIQSDITRKYGNIIYKEQIIELVNQLDDALLLDSEKYKAFEKKLSEEFNASQVRQPSHAGLAYPSDVNELSIWIDSYFNEIGPHNGYTKNRIKGLISPHIDLKRGGKSYAKAYGELASNPDCNTFFIFGTSHYADVQNPFILTRKNHLTPYGEARVNQAIIDKIEKTCSWDIYDGEIFHRDEHSIEFQVLFLQHLLNDKKEFSIVPILCNSLHKFISDGISPIENEKFSIFLSSIKNIIKDLGDKAVVIAGADLAHMGLKFGDEKAVDSSTLNWIRNKDMQSIKHSENLDPDGFFMSVAEEKDKRKICGLSPIYALLNTIDATTGKMLDYGQALEPETGSVVSYTSVGFY